jgi:very-short-patch-repair endonuclease
MPEGRGVLERGAMAEHKRNRQSQPSPPEGEGRPKAGERGYSKRTLSHAKSLRRDMTDAETNLWQHLRAKRLNGFKFRAQQPIGPFIADFLCAEQKLIIEADGSHHADNAHDAQNYRVLRFWNTDILNNIDNVKAAIYAALMTPSPNPPKPYG